MSWFDFLKRQKKQQATAPLPPIRTVQEPGAVRRERLVREAAEAEAAAPSAEQTEMARRGELFDTGSLEIAREAADGDNPYDTQSWQVGSPQAPRRVDDLKAINKERNSGSLENPYDTPIKRKGW